MVRHDHNGYDCDYAEDDIVNDPAFMKKSFKSFSKGYNDEWVENTYKNKEVTVHVDKY